MEYVVKKIIIVTLVFLMSIILISCAGNPSYAPVYNAWQQAAANKGVYRVQPGDSLYSIAWAFGLDYRTLAKINKIPPDDAISAGTLLQMYPSKEQKVEQKKKAVKSRSRPVKQKKVKHKSDRQVSSRVYWRWPTQGKIITAFSLSSGGSRGIDIAGKSGQSVKAAAKGRVVYAGSGLRGYGNLIILKHNQNYLSAYGYNKKLLVKDGDQVKLGQSIALMGSNDAGQVMMHFEIRYQGKPVNPLKYIGSKK